MADNTIDQAGNALVDPKKALNEQTLAVDLAGIELDRAVATAHRFPRSIDVAVKNMNTLATYNEDSAESCVYALPRGGKPITGPSIGFANIVMQCWGNCRVGAQIIYIDTKQKVVKAQGAFLDLETNAQSISPVDRRIADKNGRIYNDDMQIVTGMAAASIARRNAILNGVPRGIWWPIYLNAMSIIGGKAETFAENKEKAFKAMAHYGVKPEQIITYLGLKGAADITLEHIPTIRGMYSSLRDNAITVEEMFDPRRMKSKGTFATVDNPLSDVVGPTNDDGTDAQDAPDPDAGDDMADEAAEQEVAAASPAASLAASTAPEATEQRSETKPAPAASAAPAKAQQAQQADPAIRSQDQTEPAPQTAAKPAGPKNPEEYMDYWETFCANAKTETEIKLQWSADRKLRTACMIVDQFMTDAADMKNNRIAALSAGG